jgi:hypothetical protein
MQTNAIDKVPIKLRTEHNGFQIMIFKTLLPVSPFLHGISVMSSSLALFHTEVAEKP